MLNLFILVIIQQFDQYYLSEDNILAKFEGDLMVFKHSWTEFTKKNKCIKIKDNKLVSFFKHLEKPLGMTAEDLKDNNEIHKNIVQMDIRADEEGYVYFNELLYKVMKKTYGIKHIRNRKLANIESSVFAKINKQQEKMSNYLIREEKKATAVNPFLSIMYYNISFKTWLNMTRKKKEREALNYNIAGSEQSNEDFSDILHDPDENSHVSEGSFYTFRIESVASSSANFSNRSYEEEESSSSRIETITEHELEDGEKEYPDEEFKGKRLFDDEEDKKVSNIPTNIMETDERKEDDCFSEDERNNEGNEIGKYGENFNEKDQEETNFDHRKSSCPVTNPYNLPNIEKNEDNLNIIEENKHEQTFSNDYCEEESP